MASALGRRRLPLRAASSCAAARFNSSQAEKPANAAFSDLDAASSFTTPSPDQERLQAFNAAEKAKSRVKQLPGNR